MAFEAGGEEDIMAEEDKAHQAKACLPVWKVDA